MNAARTMSTKELIGNAGGPSRRVTGAHGVACGTVQARQSALKGGNVVLKSGYAGGNATTLQPPADGFCRLIAAFSRLTLSAVAHNRSNWVKVGQTGQGLVKPPVKPARDRQSLLCCNKLGAARPTTVKPSQTGSNQSASRPIQPQRKDGLRAPNRLHRKMDVHSLPFELQKPGRSLGWKPVTSRQFKPNQGNSR